jgi:hypothetical protein
MEMKKLMSVQSALVFLTGIFVALHDIKVNYDMEFNGVYAKD